jgi:hypothetical protein
MKSREWLKEESVDSKEERVAYRQAVQTAVKIGVKGSQADVQRQGLSLHVKVRSYYWNGARRKGVPSASQYSKYF